MWKGSIYLHYFFCPETAKNADIYLSSWNIFSTWRLSIFSCRKLLRKSHSVAEVFVQGSFESSFSFVSVLLSVRSPGKSRLQQLLWSNKCYWKLMFNRRFVVPFVYLYFWKNKGRPVLIRFVKVELWIFLPRVVTLLSNLIKQSCVLL